MNEEATTVPRSAAPITRAEMAILFADVSGSTRLYEAVGDAKARETIGKCIALMSASTKKFGGTLIKTIGDEVMCRFPSADAAAEAAFDMQEEVGRAALFGGPGATLAIHVGFHFGPVVEEGDDIFGDAVNVASRMVNLSKRDQIVTTGSTAMLLSPKWMKSVRQIDRAAVRGKSEEIDVYEVVWQEAESTRVAGKVWVLPEGGPPAKMIVNWGARELEVSEEHPTVTIGRGDTNELVLKDDMVSRLHARIEYRNRKFSLADQSTNGTYVMDQAGNARFVRRDSQALTGTGAILLGRKPGPNQGGLIRFKIKAL